MGDAGDSQSRLFESFAEAIVSFEKLTNIGAKFAAVVENSVVPWKETRKLLKCMNPDQISNTSLFQFMQGVLVITRRLKGSELRRTRHPISP